MKKKTTPRSFLGVAAQNIPPAISKLPVLDIVDKKRPAPKVIKPDSKKKLIDVPEDRIKSDKSKDLLDE